LNEIAPESGPAYDKGCDCRDRPEQKHVGGENMTQKTQKTKFWVILAIINIAAMIYPVSLYVQADSNDTQFFAAIVLLGIAFLLAIGDMMSAILVYMR
jgi:hypothetical protein